MSSTASFIARLRELCNALTSPSILFSGDATEEDDPIEALTQQTPETAQRILSYLDTNDLLDFAIAAPHTPLSSNVLELLKLRLQKLEYDDKTSAQLSKLFTKPSEAHGGNQPETHDQSAVSILPQHILHVTLPCRIADENIDFISVLSAQESLKSVTFRERSLHGGSALWKYGSERVPYGRTFFEHDTMVRSLLGGTRKTVIDIPHTTNRSIIEEPVRDVLRRAKGKVTVNCPSDLVTLFLTRDAVYEEMDIRVAPASDQEHGLPQEERHELAKELANHLLLRRWSKKVTVWDLLGSLPREEEDAAYADFISDFSSKVVEDGGDGRGLWHPEGITDWKQVVPDMIEFRQSEKVPQSPLATSS